MQENKFENPHEDVAKRDSYAIGTTRYDLMISVLHNELVKSQRLYYCSSHHSIETASTYEIHKSNPSCRIYTKGQLLGRVISSFLIE